MNNDFNNIPGINNSKTLWLIAKTKKIFNIGKELLLQVAVTMTRIVHGKKEVNKMRKIFLSRNTLLR